LVLQEDVAGHSPQCDTSRHAAQHERYRAKFWSYLKQPTWPHCPPPATSSLPCSVRLALLLLFRRLIISICQASLDTTC